jgi:archaetidylinositol phosphate synthase
METAKREMTFLLATPERRVLTAIARRVPRGLRSNHFTALGVLAAVGAGAAYALSARDARWLWLASAMLALNWLGDSLDGTLARVRDQQRPKYGYYIDHIVDAFNTAVIGIGIGLSPYVNLELALLLVVLYLTLSINVYLESSVFGIFKIAYGLFGPTEVRLLLVLCNLLLLGGPLVWQGFAGGVRVVANVTVALFCAGLLTLVAVRFGKNLHKLARQEPQEFRLRPRARSR